MQFEIKNRFTSAVQFTAEIECNVDASISLKLGLAVCWGFKAGADLRGAYLADAYLADAYLTGAYLTGAYLTGAYLRSADLRSADLRSADLRGAYLAGADLAGADLRSADLRGAYLRSADLRGANLAGADFGTQWVVQGAIRSDGYAFLLTNFVDEGVRVKAGCRNFTIEQSNAHWTETRGNTLLGDETFAIVRNMVDLAGYRGLSFEPAQKETA